MDSVLVSGKSSRFRILAQILARNLARVPVSSSLAMIFGMSPPTHIAAACLLRRWTRCPKSLAVLRDPPCRDLAHFSWMERSFSGFSTTVARLLARSQKMLGGCRRLPAKRLAKLVTLTSPHFLVSKHHGWVVPNLFVFQWHCFA